MNTLSGPMFEPKEHGLFRSIHNKEGAHYNIYAVGREDYTYGMDALRSIFPEGKADELNVCLFSTSGVHGTYITIEEVEDFINNPNAENEGCDTVTFLVIHPRIVCMRYGNCEPKTKEDFSFLKKLRASSWKELAKIGKA